jgi:hypothetical protein
MDHRLKALIEVRELLETEGWAPEERDGIGSDSFKVTADSSKGVPWRKLILAVLCVGVFIVIMYSTVHWALNRSGDSSEVSANSETTIQATVLSIEIADARMSIDASEDSLEAGRCWVVKVSVNRRVPGDKVVEDQTLNLLVHSPSEALGVSRKGQVCKVRLIPDSHPVEFLFSPGRSQDSIELPDTSHRRFAILTTPGS